MPTAPPRRRLPPEVLTPEEVAALISACGSGTPAASRNAALLALLYRSGLRVSEALALHPKDIDPGRGAVRVLRGKGGRSRTAGIDPSGLAPTLDWLRLRESLGWEPRWPVFCGPTGRPITSGYVRQLLPALARRAGIAKRVHAHGLRHTHASELRQERLDIGVISKQLGHSDISTTARYLDHIAPWTVVEAIGARRWDAE
jgi:site-specific recombinase XerD